MIYLCVKERGVLFGTALIILFASVAALAQAPMEIPSSADRVRTTTSRNPAASLAFDALPSVISPTLSNMIDATGDESFVAYAAVSTAVLKF